MFKNMVIGSFVTSLLNNLLKMLKFTKLIQYFGKCYNKILQTYTNVTIKSLLNLDLAGLSLQLSSNRGSIDLDSNPGQVHNLGD